MNRREGKPPAPLGSAEAKWYTAMKYAETILKWSLLVMVLATVYILYGALSGQLGGPAPLRIVANLQLVGKALAISAGVSAVCVVMITFEEIAWSVLTGIVGLGYLFGTPFIVANYARSATSPAAQAVLSWGTLAGKIIIAVAGVRIAYEVYSQLAYERPKVRKAKPQEEEEAKLAKEGETRTIWPWTPCWQMPFCHEAIREICPAFKGHKTCWRFGSGCNCDPTLVQRLIRTGGVGASGDAQQRERQREYLRADLQAGYQPHSKRTLQCAKCAIYLEHQRVKFRFFNPILVVATIAAFFVFYRPLLRLYELTIMGMAKLASRFTYGSQVEPQQWFDQLNTPTVQISFLIIVGLLVLSWVLKFTEWLILVRKL